MSSVVDTGSTTREKGTSVYISLQHFINSMVCPFSIFLIYEIGMYLTIADMSNLNGKIFSFLVMHIMMCLIINDLSE